MHILEGIRARNGLGPPAARSDFADDPSLLRRLRACPKYGNDTPEADRMAVRVVATATTCAPSDSS